MKAIADEFAGLNISAQRRWQLRKQRDRKCTQCGGPLDLARLYCKDCREVRRNEKRAAAGCQPRAITGRGRPTLEEQRGAA